MVFCAWCKLQTYQWNEDVTIAFSKWKFRPFPSCLMPMSKWVYVWNDSDENVFQQDLSSGNRFIFMQIEFIFIWKVFHEDSFMRVTTCRHIFLNLPSVLPVQKVQKKTVNNAIRVLHSMTARYTSKLPVSSITRHACLRGLGSWNKEHPLLISFPRNFGFKRSWSVKQFQFAGRVAPNYVMTEKVNFNFESASPSITGLLVYWRK